MIIYCIQQLFSINPTDLQVAKLIEAGRSHAKYYRVQEKSLKRKRLTVLQSREKRISIVGFHIKSKKKNY